MLSSYLEVKKMVASYFELDKHCCSYLEREKSGSLLFGDQKMQFTTVRSKEKDYDIYLKSKKLVNSQQEHEKNVFQLFRSGKNWFLAISILTNTVEAIWREKKVDPCYLETKKYCSQQLETRKKIMTSIQSQKNRLTRFRSTKKRFPSYLEAQKTGSQLFRV